MGCLCDGGHTMKKRRGDKDTAMSVEEAARGTSLESNKRNVRHFMSLGGGGGSFTSWQDWIQYSIVKKITEEPDTINWTLLTSLPELQGGVAWLFRLWDLAYKGQAVFSQLLLPHGRLPFLGPYKRISEAKSLYSLNQHTCSLEPTPGSRPAFQECMSTYSPPTYDKHFTFKYDS